MYYLRDVQTRVLRVMGFSWESTRKKKLSKRYSYYDTVVLYNNRSKAEINLVNDYLDDLQTCVRDDIPQAVLMRALMYNLKLIIIVF